MRLAVFLLAIASPLAAQGGTRPSASEATSLVVSTQWLAARLQDPAVVVLHIAHDSSFRAGHIPGARELPYMAITARRGTVSSELPEPEQLRGVLERLGISDGSTVVVYGHEGPMVTRVLFSLEYLGHPRYAMLDGGLERWTAERRPIERGAAPQVATGRMTGRLRPELVVTADWIVAHQGRPGVAFIDTRTDGEYLGSGNRSGMPSAGHLADARQLEWEELFQDGSSTLLRPREELARLFADRTRPGDIVVTYCWVGYRASATWFAARLLGYDARLYDGSYQDWQQRGLPVRSGDRP